jgi:uncharacterized protein YbaP (TraB family)
MKRFRGFALALMTTLGGSGLAHAAPAMWLVSDSDSKVWLFGSVHVMKAGVDWRTPLLDGVVAVAEHVYFEADVSPSPEMQRSVWMGMKSGLNDIGKRLNDFLTPEQIETVKTGAKSINFPMTTLQMFKPWMAALMLSSKSSIGGAFDPNKGVDVTLMAEVDPDRREFFETAEFQLKIFAGLSDAEQVTLLMETVAELGQSDDEMSKLLDAWEKGDTSLDKMVGEWTAGGGELTERVLSRRNTAWVEELTKLLDLHGEDALVVVGAAHMSGAEGLPALLKTAGYEVERVQ